MGRAAVGRPDSAGIDDSLDSLTPSEKEKRKKRAHGVRFPKYQIMITRILGYNHCFQFL